MIFFAHSNGFPGSCYQYLFDCLAPLEVDFIERLGHGKYDIDEGWGLLADELIACISNRHTDPVIGMGHSLGGMLIYFAALKRPELFEKIVLLDPIMFSPLKRAGIKLAKLSGMIDRFPPASKAATRRTDFSDREEAHRYFSEKSLFRNFHPRCFKDYIQHGLIPKGRRNGLELTFSAKIEQQVFRNVPTRLPKNQLRMPAFVLYSKKYEVLKSSDIAFAKKRLKGATFIPVEGGHLFPQEKPEATAKLVRKLLA